MLQQSYLYSKDRGYYKRHHGGKRRDHDDRSGVPWCRCRPVATKCQDY